MRAAGRHEEAAAEEARAIELWEAKGATLLVERADRPAQLAVRPSRAVEKSARRLPPNAATASAARFEAAVVARDEDAFLRQFAEEDEVVHHPTGAVWDRDGTLAMFRPMWRADDPVFRMEPLATLGDTLALCRHSASAERLAGKKYDVGAFESREILVFAADAQGRIRQIEFFANDRFADAISRLYERYAELLPEGPARVRAAATARSVARLLLGLRDPDHLAETFAPDIEFRDRRAIVSWGEARGKEAVLRGLRIAFEAVREVAFRVDDILASRSDALVFQSTVSGIDRTSGGAYERQHLQVETFGADGLLTRLVWFDVERAEDALAEFDALPGELDQPREGQRSDTRGPAAPPRFANTAIRTVDRFDHAWAARDWDGVTALYAPGYRCSDRRSIARLELDREQFLETNRAAFNLAVSKHHRELLATRGDRLVLFRVVYRGSGGDVGPLETEWLSINEVDERGAIVASVMLDPDDLDAAYAELDDRYAAGEGKPYALVLANMRAFRKASAERDWETVARLLPIDFTLVSHRRLVGTGTPLGRDEYLATRGAVDNLGVRGDLRFDHQLRLSARAGVIVTTWYGTLDGGDFEDPFIVVYGHDGTFAHSVEIFDVDQLDRALARYEELSSALPRPPRITNAATRAIDRMDEAWAAHDWARVCSGFAPEFRMLDRRSMVRLEPDRDQHLESMRRIFEMSSSSFRNEVLATRGDRLVLTRLRFEGSGRAIGPSEIELLAVLEVNGHGEPIAGVMLDPDDLDAAYAELDDRYDDGEGSAYGHATMTRTFRRAWAVRDWETLTALLAPDLTVNDHRLLGWETLHGPGPYIRALQSLVDLAPDVQLRLDHVLGISQRGIFYSPTWIGTREGGAFEEPSLIVAELDGSKRFRRFDQYNLDQLEEARARFDAIPASPRRDPSAGTVTRG